jgi:hypothetical protein
MSRWEYITLVYGTGDRLGRRWVVTAPNATSKSRQVGAAEKGRWAGRIWQAMRLLETALKELDADGWELVTASLSGLFNLYGTAVLRRPIAQKDNPLQHPQIGAGDKEKDER